MKLGGIDFVVGLFFFFFLSVQALVKVSENQWF